jgi:hypothetical protein
MTGGRVGAAALVTGIVGMAGLVALGLQGACASRAEMQSGAAVAEYRATLETFCEAGELPAADCEAHRRHLLALLKGEADAAEHLVAEADRIEQPTVRARLRRLADRLTGRGGRSRRR